MAGVILDTITKRLGEVIVVGDLNSQIGDRYFLVHVGRSSGFGQICERVGSAPTERQVPDDRAVAARLNHCQCRNQ